MSRFIKVVCLYSVVIQMAIHGAEGRPKERLPRSVDWMTRLVQFFADKSIVRQAEQRVADVTKELQETQAKLKKLQDELNKQIKDKEEQIKLLGQREYASHANWRQETHTRERLQKELQALRQEKNSLDNQLQENTLKLNTHHEKEKQEIVATHAAEQERLEEEKNALEMRMKQAMQQSDERVAEKERAIKELEARLAKQLEKHEQERQQMGSLNSVGLKEAQDEMEKKMRELKNQIGIEEEFQESLAHQMAMELIQMEQTFSENTNTLEGFKSVNYRLRETIQNLIKQLQRASEKNRNLMEEVQDLKRKLSSQKSYVGDNDDQNDKELDSQLKIKSLQEENVELKAKNRELMQKFNELELESKEMLEDCNEYRIQEATVKELFAENNQLKEKLFLFETFFEKAKSTLHDDVFRTIAIDSGIITSKTNERGENVYEG